VKVQRESAIQPTATPRRANSERTLWQEIVRSRQAYLMLSPIFVVLAVFVYYPPLSALYHAFFDWQPTGETTFVGLGNFRAMLEDQVLLDSFWNMLRLLVFAVIATTTVPLVIAELIYSVRSVSAKYIYRLWFLVPVVAPLIVIILLWRFIYDPNVGLLNGMLEALGLPGWTRAWLGDPNIALYALMFIGFPFVSGTSVLIYLAGLMNIPKEILEAAELDGVVGLRRIWWIDLPLLAGQIKLFLVLGTIGALQGFEIQLILTQGGPGWATQVPGLVMYQRAFEGNRFGYASAIGLVLFVIALILTVINFKFVRSSSEFEGR
jgi:ABC-type sugar transport system permease subunit